MKQFIPAAILLVIILISCGRADKKADPADITIETIKDTAATVPAAPDIKNSITNSADTAILTTTTAPKSTQKKIKPNNAGRPRGTTRGLTMEPGDILAGIDEYLISKVEFKTAPAGGFTNCLVTITNTLPDVTFQKAIVEVVIQKQDGAEVKRAYFTVLSIEPGMSKVIRVPNSTQGTQVMTQVVKVKSNELTKGEWELAGNH
ncbi:MAG: hypothetical protein SGI83_14165 [Bacteroidota bacterium]|nr:hypothetical protein [Bacteroidota bacterium]